MANPSAPLAYRRAVASTALIPVAVLAGFTSSALADKTWIAAPFIVLVLLLVRAGQPTVDAFRDARPSTGWHPGRRFRDYIYFCADSAGWNPRTVWWSTLATWTPLAAWWVIVWVLPLAGALGS